MSEQLALDIQVEHRLKPRQQLVLDAVAATGRHGLTDGEAGALLYPNANPVDRGFYGNQILRRLRDLGLVRYRRAARGEPGVWLYDGEIAKSSYQPPGMLRDDEPLPY